jgi:hypothetical protein
LGNEPASAVPSHAFMLALEGYQTTKDKLKSLSPKLLKRQLSQQYQTVFLIFRCSLSCFIYGDIAEVQLLAHKIGRLPWQQCFPSADCFRDKDRYSSGSTRRHEISCQQRPSPDEKHPDNPLRYATIRCNANSQSSILLETTSKFKLPGKFLRICLYQSRLTAYTEEPTSLKFVCHSNPSRIRPNDHLETSGPGRPTD